MRSKEIALAQQLDTGLLSFDQEKLPLPGIRAPAHRESFVGQLVESIRRIRYVSVITRKDLSILRADPSSDHFDPAKAAVLHQRQGNTEEAFWLVFLLVHFGKNLRTGWRLARDIYGGLGGTARWDWPRTSANPQALSQWIATNQTTLQGGDGVERHFGNHRKYETLKATSHRATGKVIESYVNWICPPRIHQVLVQEALDKTGGDPRKTFDYLYRSMDDVISFGRTARFDYLTMVGKLGLAPIKPGSTYMQGATGPLAGARLLFGKNVAAPILDTWLLQLETHLDLYFGMQVLEDALCNWQKSPAKFKPFRG